MNFTRATMSSTGYGSGYSPARKSKLAYWFFLTCIFLFCSILLLNFIILFDFWINFVIKCLSSINFFDFSEFLLLFALERLRQRVFSQQVTCWLLRILNLLPWFLLFSWAWIICLSLLYEPNSSYNNANQQNTSSNHNTIKWRWVLCTWSTQSLTWCAPETTLLAWFVISIPTFNTITSVSIQNKRC